jgi:site-specific recombinase XerD
MVWPPRPSSDAPSRRQLFQNNYSVLDLYSNLPLILANQVVCSVIFGFTSSGFLRRRDYALMLFLYNSGARCDEAAQLTIADLHYTPSKWDSGSVVLHGKGEKMRRCPLWFSTLQTLHPLVVNRKPDEHVFMNRHNLPIRRNGIFDVVKRHGKRAALQVPQLQLRELALISFDIRQPATSLNQVST